MKSTKIKPIEAWAIVSKTRPKLDSMSVYDNDMKKEIMLEDDEKFIKVIIKEI